MQDRFLFKEIKVSELTHPHKGYPGVEVSMMAYLERQGFKIAIDIGL